MSLRPILWALLWPIRWWNALPKPPHIPLWDPWTYGTCNGSRARRHRWSGEVQFVLWRAGEQGHVEDFWHPMHSDHWKGFLPGKIV